MQFSETDDLVEINAFLTTNHTNSCLQSANEQQDILYKHESFKINSCIYAVNKKLVMNYLAATGYNFGLLINFNAFPKADIIRIVR